MNYDLMYLQLRNKGASPNAEIINEIYKFVVIEMLCIEIKLL